jgi:hypothetical protein
MDPFRPSEFADDVAVVQLARQLGDRLLLVGVVRLAIIELQRVVASDGIEQLLASARVRQMQLHGFRLRANRHLEALLHPSFVRPLELTDRRGRKPSWLRIDQPVIACAKQNQVVVPVHVAAGYRLTSSRAGWRSPHDVALIADNGVHVRLRSAVHQPAPALRAAPTRGGPEALARPVSDRHPTPTLLQWTGHFVPQPTSGPLRKLDAIAVLTDPLLPAPFTGAAPDRARPGGGRAPRPRLARTWPATGRRYDRTAPSASASRCPARRRG